MTVRAKPAAPADQAPTNAATPGQVDQADQAPGDGHAEHAEHGYRNEVSWDGGDGRQPYANQGEREAREPNLGDAFAEGERGAHSGKALEELEQVRGKP